MPKQRIFRPQRIYYPDTKQFLKVWINGSNSHLTRDRIVFKEPCGRQGMSMRLLIDKSGSELEEMLALGGVERKMAGDRKIVLVATWPEYPRRVWTKEIDAGEERHDLAGLVMEAAVLFKSIVDELKGEGNDNPYVGNDLPTRYPVSFDQIVLISLDKTSNEEDREEWWQVMIAVDIDTDTGT